MIEPWTALRIAAIEKYKSDVLDTGMLDMMVGPNQEYADMEDFISQTIEEWIRIANEGLTI